MEDGHSYSNELKVVTKNQNEIQIGIELRSLFCIIITLFPDKVYGPKPFASESQTVPMLLAYFDLLAI